MGGAEDRYENTWAFYKTSITFYIMATCDGKAFGTQGWSPRTVFTGWLASRIMAICQRMGHVDKDCNWCIMVTG